MPAETPAPPPAADPVIDAIDRWLARYLKAHRGKRPGTTSVLEFLSFIAEKLAVEHVDAVDRQLDRELAGERDPWGLVGQGVPARVEGAPHNDVAHVSPTPFIDPCATCEHAKVMHRGGAGECAAISHPAPCGCKAYIAIEPGAVRVATAEGWRWERIDRTCPQCGAAPAIAADLPLVACLACGWKLGGKLRGASYRIVSSRTPADIPQGSLGLFVAMSQGLVRALDASPHGVRVELVDEDRAFERPPVPVCGASKVPDGFWCTSDEGHAHPCTPIPKTHPGARAQFHRYYVAGPRNERPPKTSESALPGGVVLSQHAPLTPLPAGGSEEGRAPIADERPLSGDVMGPYPERPPFSPEPAGIPLREVMRRGEAARRELDERPPSGDVMGPYPECPPVDLAGAFRAERLALMDAHTRNIEALTGVLQRRAEYVDMARANLTYPVQDFRQALKSEADGRRYIAIVRAVVCHHCKGHLGIPRESRPSFDTGGPTAGVSRWQLARFWRNHNPCQHAPKDAPEAKRTSVSILIDTWTDLADRPFLIADPPALPPSVDPKENE